MSNPRDLIVGFHDQKAHPRLGAVVGVGGKVRAYPTNSYTSGLPTNTVNISITNSDDDKADHSWMASKSVHLTREQAKAFILAIAEAIRDMK